MIAILSDSGGGSWGGVLAGIDFVEQKDMNE